MRFVRSLFVRALGGVYFAAFKSLGVQVRGLYGKRGVLPIAELTERAKQSLGREAWRHYPSIFLVDASDETLENACRAGCALSVALMLGVAPRATLSALWALYVSFVAVGRDFLSFQWDILLLETTIPAILMAPTRRGTEPPLPGVALMRWYAARFFYEAGIAKVRSGDETWAGRTACSYHYQTQPLPTPLAWQAHQLPARAQRVSTAGALAIEIYTPFLALAPRPVRWLGFASLAGLQLLIAATGNYGFFNPLSVALSLWYLDDTAMRKRHKRHHSRRPSWVERIFVAAGTAPLFLATLGAHWLRYGKKRALPSALERLVDFGQRAHSLGAYGLFASMTTRRPEIVIEGSNDGEEWREYTFKFKPGDPQSKPRWVAPHQPRLDWQMWFAALGFPPRWFFRLLERLLEGAPDVLALLEPSPFGDSPPKYVRALLYDYQFTDRKTHRETGAWWNRKLLGTYVPPIALSAQS